MSTLPWIQVVTLTGAPPQHVDTSLGSGEREVIQLALLKPNPLVILDDLDARREANRLSIQCTGVLGILLKAKQDGRIGDIGLLLDDLQRAGFYLNAATRSHVLRLAGESP